MRRGDTIQRERGFTLIEVGIIVPLLIVSVLVIFDALFMMLSSSATERATSTSAYDIQATLNLIEKDASLTSRFLPTTDSSLTDPYPPSGGWSYVGDGSQLRTLILRTYATTANPLASSRQPVFLDTLGCSSTTIYYNDVMTYNTIFFVKNGNLYRRRLISTSTGTCSTPYQRLSCPTSEDLAAQGIMGRDSSCQADDELVVSGVSAFNIQYYDASNGTTPIDAYSGTADPSSLLDANAVDVTLTLSRKAMGKPTSVTSHIRMTKLSVIPPAQ